MAIKDSKRFSEICSGIQSLVLAVAVIIGGGWTLFTFRTLHQKEKAQKDLAQLQTQVEQNHLNQQLEERELEAKSTGCIEVQIDAKQVNLPQKNHRYVSGNVRLANRGHKNMEMQFKSSPPIAVFRADLARPGNPVFTKLAHFPLIRASNPSIPLHGGMLIPSESAAFPFMVPVTNSGAYLITFSVDAQQMDSKAIPIGEKGVYQGSTFIVVK